MMESNYNELIIAIVRQAVDDWRKLIREGKKSLATQEGGKISFTEIRQFFKSDYCKGLLKTEPLIILDQLEKELREARENGALI